MRISNRSGQPLRAQFDGEVDVTIEPDETVTLWGKVVKLSREEVTEKVHAPEDLPTNKMNSWQR